MERLTFDGSFCDISKCAETPGGSFRENGACSQRKVWERLKDYEDTGLEPEQVKELAHDTTGPLHRKIGEWLDAEADGRVVVLPCKVGQRVFALLDTDKRISECEVKQIGLGNEIAFVAIEPIDARGREYGVSLKGFGKTVFLTREKAEKALEAMKHGGTVKYGGDGEIWWRR